MRITKVFQLLMSLFAGAMACEAGVNFFEFPGGAYAPYWAERPLEAGDTDAEFAVIFVHGLSRQPRDQSPTLRALTQNDPRAARVIFAMPAFFSPRNRPEELKDRIALWDIREHDWRRGDLSFGEAGISSFAVLDRMYELLSDRQCYPKLKHILLCGFSAGGQVVNRYVAVGRFARSAHLQYSFAVGAPSTYLYPDGRRPTAQGTFCEPDPPVAEWDSWHLGLRDRNPYSRDLSRAEIFANLTARPTLYLCGEADVEKSGLAISPGAMTQGENRYRRFLNYRRYVGLFPEWSRQCRFVSVPKYGHQWRGVASAPEFVRLIFGERD